MGGNNSRLRLLLRRSERDQSDTEEEEEEEEGWQPDEDDTSGDDSFDSGNVQDMLRYLLRYRLISRYQVNHMKAYPMSLLNILLVAVIYVEDILFICMYFIFLHRP